MITVTTKEKRDWDAIEEEMIYGIVSDDGKKEYLSLKDGAEHYNIPYQTFRTHAAKGHWLDKRGSHSTRVKQKVEEKKSEYDAELIVQADEKFQDDGETLRRVTKKKLKVMEEELDNPEKAKYVRAYDLKMAGDALAQAQSVVKAAQGEILERSKVEVDGKGRIDMNVSLLKDPDWIASKREAMDDYYQKKNKKS